MLRNNDERQSEALGWHIRLRDGSAADWEAFTDWLEQSPENSAAYDAIVLADEGMGGLLALAQPAGINDNMQGEQRPKPRLIGRRTALGFASAAAVFIAGLVAYPMMSSDDSRYAVETGQGIQRSISLTDGTRIDLNGGTRIMLSRNNLRLASLERGEATFSVVHDASNPFIVESGNARIQDVGTIFNVTQDNGRLELAVAEGSVVFNPDAEAVQLTAGNTLRVAPNEGGIVVGSVDPKAVASWRNGRLVYDRATLGTVARDISRAIGTRVEISPDIAAQPFTGVIIIDRNQGAFFGRLEGLLDVHARRTATGWRLTSRTRAHS
jgi:transmembrane sensor